MDPNSFKYPSAGTLVPTTSGAFAFVPAPLPPKLVWNSKSVALISATTAELAKLSATSFPYISPYILARPLVHQEAVMSSMIEGTVATLEEVLSYEALGSQASASVSAAKEVHNYVRAMDHGVSRMRELPISLRLMRELHAILLEGVRGQEYAPGEFRRTQNFIGKKEATISEARYVPPPVIEMHQCLDILEEFIHAKDDLPPVVRAALTHYQFEAIHPFMDGNGRVGRVLIVMMLMQAGLLSQPNLYLSAFLEAHRQEYNDHLLAVSQAGDWVAWLQFFLRAVASQALDAHQRLNALSQLRTTYENQLARDRAGDRLLRVVDLVFARPVVSVRQVGKELGVPFVSARRYVDRLVQDGILTEITGRRKDRLFRADEVVRIVTAPLVK